MASPRAAAPVRRTTGRHRRPSRAGVVVPTGVTGGLLLASAATGIASAAPAAASEQEGSVSSSASGSTSSGSAEASGASTASHTSGLPEYPDTLLTKGDNGQYVEMVQEQLGTAADGIFGPATESAVVEFQQEQGLTVDGIVGPETWSALRAGGSGSDARSGGSDGSSATQVSLASNSSGSSSAGRQAIRIAAQQEGDPYSYGAAGPDLFDCSGLVKYAFGKLGHSLPHNAQMQYDKIDHVSRSNLQPGDVVFLADSSGNIYHNGIYAGDGQWWVARHSGTTVTKQSAYWMDGGYDWRVGRVG